MTNLDSILKSRDITCQQWSIQSRLWFFQQSRMDGESCTIKKAEHRRIDAFEPWCWRRLLRVRWTARRSNQSILKEINPKYSLEGMMLKLKLQYFDYLMRRTDLLEKTLMLRKTQVCFLIPLALIQFKDIWHILYDSVQFSSVTQSCPTLCNPMNCSTPGFPVLHHLPELAQTHVH